MEHNKKTNLEVIDFALTEKGTPLKVKTTDNDGRPVWTYLANGDDVLVITSPGVYPYRGGVIEVDTATVEPLTITNLDFDEEVPSGKIWSPVKVQIPEEEKVFTNTQGGMPITAPRDKIWTPIRINIPADYPLYTTETPSTGGYQFKFKNMITNFFDTSTSGVVDGYLTDTQPTFIQYLDKLGVMFNTQVVSARDDTYIQFTGGNFVKFGKIGDDFGDIEHRPYPADAIMQLVDYQRGSSGTPMQQFSDYVGYYIDANGSGWTTTALSYYYHGTPLYQWLFDTDLGTYGCIHNLPLDAGTIYDLLPTCHGYGIKAIHVEGFRDNTVPFSETTTSGDPYFGNFQDLEYLALKGIGGEIQTFDGSMFKDMANLKSVLLDMLAPGTGYFLNPSDFLSGCTSLEHIYVKTQEAYNSWYTFFVYRGISSLASLVTRQYSEIDWIETPTGINNNKWWNRRLNTLWDLAWS